MPDPGLPIEADAGRFAAGVQLEPAADSIGFSAGEPLGELRNRLHLRDFH